MVQTSRYLSILLVGIAACIGLSDAVRAQPVPYNPYAETQESLPPVAADGTLHWGPFYKSAAIQKSYERLWNLGACRGTNKAITTPVERNKLVIDNLPEASFSGRVRATAGTAKGGLVAFTEGDALHDSAPLLVAQLHPAGVTQMQIGGPAAATALKSGMTVRLRAQVDEKGRASSPLQSLEIISPPPGFVPDPIRPNTADTVIGEIQRVNNSMLVVQVAAGTIRRLTLPLSKETSIMVVDASRLDLVSPGDSLEVTGRRWAGEGCMGTGTVFASQIIVHKAAPTAAAPGRASPLAVGAR
jgi:hypothetical protein